uniref:Uncharacterized protein n=1 Tax=Glossina pallidipes TaxID=7398 RepID=A0A1A9ZRL0_GLOPL
MLIHFENQMSWHLIDYIMSSSQDVVDFVGILNGLLDVVDVVTFKSVASEVLVGVLLLLTAGAVEFAIVVIAVIVVVISLIALGDELGSNTSLILPPQPPAVLTAPKVFVAEMLLSGVVKSDIVPISETSLLVSSALLSVDMSAGRNGFVEIRGVTDDNEPEDIDDVECGGGDCLWAMLMAHVVVAVVGIAAGVAKPLLFADNAKDLRFLEYWLVLFRALNFDVNY